VICAAAMVLLGVFTIPQSYKGIDWNTCILVGSMTPLATAMTQAGAAERIAENLVTRKPDGDGAGGYKFSDYWKFGLPILIWWLVVAVVVVPLYWRF
jgi:di/tricarboxylate transporter